MKALFDMLVAVTLSSPFVAQAQKGRAAAGPSFKFMPKLNRSEFKEVPLVRGVTDRPGLTALIAKQPGGQSFLARDGGFAGISSYAKLKLETRSYKPLQLRDSDFERVQLTSG